MFPATGSIIIEAISPLLLLISFSTYFKSLYGAINVSFAVP